MAAVAAMNTPIQAKTFSRARVVETIRLQYRQLEIQKEIMDECIEKLKELDNDEYYRRSLSEAMILYRQGQASIKTWCDSFGISKAEIDPQTVA